MKKTLSVNKNASLRKGNREQGTGNRGRRHTLSSLSLSKGASILASSFVICYLLFVICSCEQPFKAGLGPIIDLQDPTIVLESPNAGTYIHGAKTFKGSAADDNKLESIWFHISNFPLVELPYDKLQKHPLSLTGNYYRITPDSPRTDRKWTWKFNIDTMELDEVTGERKFPDGYLKIRLLAIDHVTKWVVTDEIVFNIKNNPPLITVDAPPVQQGDGAYDLGDHSLNAEFLTNYINSNTKPTNFKRTVQPETAIQGMINDFEGVYRGDEMWAIIAEDGDPIINAEDRTPILDDEKQIKVDKDGNPKTPKIDESGQEVTVKLFPPQIRFWEVYFGEEPPDTFAKPYKAGEIPPPEDVPWLDLKKFGSLIDTGGNSLAFFYFVPDASGHYFAFQVRAQSTDVMQSSTVYPEDYIPDFEEKSDTFKKENSYVLVYVTEFQEDPTLDIYRLEDIWGKDAFLGRSGDVATYKELNIKEPEKSDGNYPYIDETVVNRNGAFTLRMKASHSGGIASAKVYWETSNKSQKGRFIWDPVDKPYPEWPGAIPSKSGHYSTWGLNEPDGDTRVRSFVFTYTDLNPKGATANTATADRLDKDAIEFLNNVSGDIRNMSKIQRYTGGTSGQISPEGKPYTYNDLPEDRGNWQDVYYLEDGKYNIYVYAISNSGAPSPKPYRIELTIDRIKPSIALNYIEGSAKEEKNEQGEKLNTVNGVIQPRFIITEKDTGFHIGRPEEPNNPQKPGYFHRLPPNPGDSDRPSIAGPENYYDEQAYILVSESDKDTVDKYFATGDYYEERKNIWPDFTKMLGRSPVYPEIKPEGQSSVKVWKSGVVIDSVCRFRTSPIYHIPDLPTPNPDITDPALEDGNYRLYVFVRDNAFNVGSNSWPIIVKRETDIPTFDFSIGSTNTGVTEPDSAYDAKGGKYAAALPYQKSFIAKEGDREVNRNEFNANSVIQVRIRDDDSLNLGVEGEDASNNSGVEVTFIRSIPYVDPVTKVIELEPYDVQIPAGSGNYRYPDHAAYLMRLGQTDLKKAFNPVQEMEGSKRTAVKDSTGSISHDMLLDLLKHTQKYNEIFGAAPGEDALTIPPTSPKNGISTIPDGVYRVGISICDYSPAKLIMEWPYTPVPDTKLADVVTVNKMPVPIPASTPPLSPTYTEYFWIYVDNNYPVIQITDESKFSNSIIPPDKPMDLEGTVSDENGPITLVNWKVKSGSLIESEMGKTPLKTDSPRIIAAQPGFEKMEAGKWVYKFSYKLDMNGRADGTYDFELTFQDRFGNKTTKTLRNKGDSVPPNVSLTKKIETFSRTMLADAELKPGVYPQKAAPDVNKERLSVKVVNFTINATDANGVKGVRWWLLPADTGADNNGLNGTGLLQSTNSDGRPSNGYDAFPSKSLGYDIPGVWYGQDLPSATLKKGAYGVVDVAKKKFTIALDSRKLPQPNGEYRLHIVAIDNADNCSSYVDETILLGQAPNVFQEVFFLQAEDAPYLDKGITPGYIDPLIADEGLGWPTKKGTTDPVEMDVLGGAPIIRGTIWENNGFFQADGTTLAWPGSIVIWFSSGEPLPPDWEDKVKSDPKTTASNITGYTKKIIPNDIPAGNRIGIGRQGKNISLAIELSALFPDDFKEDGNKRYIIRATDSPVNKLKELIPYSAPADYNSIDGNAYKRGIGLTDSDDEIPNIQGDTAGTNVREFRYRQYAFVYDAVPPKVVIDTPVKKPVQTFGKTFKNDFILGGYIADANLEKTADGKYYFDYYLNSETKKRFTLEPRADLVNINVDVNGVPKAGQPSLPTHLDKDGITPLPGPADSALVEGKHIYAITKDDKGKITVYFRIKASEVTKEITGIIPESKFNGLPEGQQTLTLWGTDKGGKEGVDWVDFIKDMEPPKITFTNLTGDNKNYDKDNKSRVDAKTPANPVNGWWNKTGAQRQNYLLGTSTITPLPLTTISYDTGKPQLRGTITDLVSNIKLTTGSNTAVGTGDINIEDSAFMYWIDNETTPRYLAVIDGKDTKSVRWTINLTKNGTIAADDPPLYDGVHTIVLTAADTAGEEIAEADRYMIAFRIDSKAPRAVASDGRTATERNTVYGNVAYQNSGSTSMFTLTVAGDDANLERVEMRIVNTTKTGDEGTKVTFTARDSLTWTYYPAGSSSFTPPLPSTFPFGTPPALDLAEDYILFNGSYNVPKTMFTDSGKYEVTVAAYDSAKNKSEEFVFQFTYDRDKPGIEFTNPADETKNASPALIPQDFVKLVNNIPETIEGVLTRANNINRLTSQQLRIQGNVKDTFSPVIAVQSRVERWNWDTRAWVEVEDWAPVKDYSTNTQLQVAWTKNLLGQDTPETGGTGLDISKTPTALADAVNNPLGEGLYRIKVRARDASAATPPPATNTFTNNWDDPVGSGTAAANGIGNPVFSDYVYFYYDRTDPKLEITGINGSLTSMDTYYSKPKDGFTFEGTVTDNNRFAKVEVTFVSGTKTDTKTAVMSKFDNADPAISLNQGAIKQKWKAEFPDAKDYPDGKYKVIVTVYDMTGRYTSETKSFTLDSTPPTLKFTLPAKVLNKGYGDDSENKKPTPNATNPNSLLDGFASQIVPGGPTAVITGQTNDKPGKDGEAGSESGIDQMWFHLGYIDGITDNTNYPFPTKAAIKAWEDTLIGRHAPAGTNVAAMSVKERNEWMDKIAEYRVTAADTASINKGNAWFKLGGTLKPTGFVINNPNIYDWRFEIPEKTDAMPQGDPNYADNNATIVDGKAISQAGVEIGGLKLYGGTITLKGRQYTVGSSATRQMVRAVDGQPGGVYRLPLWVRLTDVAGNVEYYCHDIWIDMNGSIPSTSIESPSNGTQYNARGGTISVDGVARSNTSVYDVIFRVFADARPDTNLDGIQTNGRPTSRNKLIDGTPNVADIVRITGYDPAESTTVNLLPAVYRPGAGETWTWQRANLTLKGGSGEPIIPWSIMLNSEDQIKNLISSKGFNSANPANSTPTNRDMIRVWMEVFVFNGEGAPVRSSVYPNDNLGTGNGLAYDNISPGPLYGTADPPGATTPTNAKPYVRAFYIRTGAAAITHPNVGTWTADYKAPTPPPNPAHLPRANFTWNGEDSQKQGGGGYGGAGTETRSNKFAISATLDPNPSGTSGSGLGEVAYRIKLDDGSYGTWTTVWKANTPVNPANPDGPKIQPESIDSNGVRISLRNDPPSGGNRIRYYFDYAINSKVTGNSTDTGAAGTTNFAPVNGGNWATTGGTVTIQIRMKDNSPQPNEAEQTIQVGVDNFAPLTDINYRTNPKVAGSNVNFMGRVYDYATTPPMNTDYTPRKLERVSVWFTRGGPTGPYVNLNQKNTTAATLTGMRTINVYQNRQAAIGGGGVNDAVSSITLSTTSPGTVTNNFSYPGLGTQQPYNADYVRDITQATGQPQYKMLWSPVNAAVYDVRWQLTLDSTLLPDGELTLHYIVVDAAGNASYYTQTGISVRNNYPEITSVTLYTDNNGKGAQYTMDDTGVYPLNDYRSKMFANYTDPSDNQIPSGGAFRKTDTTGYLNSGFISKNSYLGFKVETNGGNRPLTFRLQHVKRQRLELTAATLNQMITDRTAASPTTINLYTIAWHGNYTPQKWRALGVPIDNNPNPTLGTHFVFNPVNISDPNQPFNVADAVGTAEVWKYTTAPAVTIADITNQGTAGSDDTVVYGPANNFRFNGATHFNSTASPAQNTPVTQIGEYDGSHPTAGDAKADNPNTTAFFLIRVWDSINSSTGEMGVNDKLYDAVVIGANVYLTDKNDPVARLYDLNPYTEAAVIENNKNQTIKDAANPTAVGSNIVRGGLYNDGSSSKMVRSGFIDPRNGSTTLNPKNGVYFRDQSLAATAPSQLVSGLDWPDYPLRVAGDAATGTTPNPERDKVSGRIILRGFAWDDQLIDEITLTLPNAPTSRTILKLNDTTGKMAATTGYTDTAFVVEELHWKTGHSVEWAYIWDTGTDPATNQTIRVTVKDKNGGRSSAAIPSDVTAPATALAFHNQAIVDIVPYITGFERKTPDFSTKRSLQGWYSFFRGEQGIKVNGYNFGTTAATITIGGANMTNTGAATATQRTFNIPDSTTVNSGEILMTTSVAAYNNTSSTTGKSWNKEANSYTPGSDLWINHHYAHIWRSNAEAGNGSISNAGAGTYFAAAGTSEGLDSPGMSLQYTGTYAGRLHGVWTNYSRETVFYAQNHNVKGSASGVEVTQNVATHTVSTRGESTFGQPGSLLLLKCGEPYSAGDIDYYNPAGSSPNEYTNNVSVSAAWQRDGEPMLVISPRLSSIVFNNANSQDGGGHHRGYFISRQNSPTSTYRWKNTRIKKVAPSTADNNPGKVFVTAYDSTYKRLFFKTVSGNLDWNNSDSQTNDDNGGTALYLDGGGALSGLSYGSIGAATGGAGEWAAVDTTTNGNPVVAYFDAQHQTLRLAYAGNTTPAAGNWTVRYVIPSASPLYLGSGSYVSMKIDHNNRIHLAFYNSTYKAVVYATAASPSGDFTASVIDRVVEGGQWTDIAVDRSGNPWIVYADSSRIGNPDGARIAYRSYGNSYAAAAEPIEATGAAPVGAFGRDLKDPISGKSIKGWEAITMPASYNVKEDRLNIESWPPSGGAAGLAADCPIGSWNAAVGYGSDLFRIGYFFKPASSGVMRN
jgi:hypothetical protein